MSQSVFAEFKPAAFCIRVSNYESTFTKWSVGTFGSNGVNSTADKVVTHTRLFPCWCGTTDTRDKEHYSTVQAPINTVFTDVTFNE